MPIRRGIECPEATFLLGNSNFRAVCRCWLRGYAEHNHADAGGSSERLMLPSQGRFRFQVGQIEGKK